MSAVQADRRRGWEWEPSGIRIVETPELRVGAVVRLKSGGPLMTVKQVFTGEESVRTVWFHDGQLLTNTFAAALLEIVR